MSVEADIGSAKTKPVRGGCGVVEGVIVGVGVNVEVTEGVGVKLATIKVCVTLGVIDGVGVIVEVRVGVGVKVGVGVGVIQE